MDKWVMFKNYMHNELGITKEDIHKWVRDAVQDQARQLVKQATGKFSIDDMVKDAETHSEEDKKAKELIELKNESDNLIYSIEKMIKENGEKMDSAQIHQIETEIQSLRNALNSDNINSIRNAKSNLEQVFQSIGQNFQSRNEGQSNFQEENQNVNEQTNENSDAVYDADYEIVDDEDEKKAS